MLCPTCAKENPENVLCCIYCGADLKPVSSGGTSSASHSKPGAAAPKKKVPTWAIAVGAVAVVAGLLVCAIVAAAIIISRLGGANQVLVGKPTRAGEMDLYLARLGQDLEDATLVAEDAGLNWVAVQRLEGGRYSALGLGQVGGFLPGSDRVLLWYTEDGDSLFQQMRVGDREPTTVLESDGLSGVTVVDDFLFLEETQGGRERCYIARGNREAERVARADTGCDLSLDAKWIILTNVSREETTVSIVDLGGENEQVLLDDVEDVASFEVSGDVSHLAYVRGRRGEYQLYLLERRSGDQEKIGDEVDSVLAYEFAPRSDTLFYVVREDAGDEEVRLYELGDNRPLARATTIEFRFSPDGRYIAYTVGDEDGDEKLYVRSVRGGDSVEVADGGGIEFGYIETEPGRLLALITDRNTLKLVSADLSGRDAIELLNEEGVSVSELNYVPGEPTLYLGLEDEDRRDILFVTPVNRAGGVRLLEDWDSIDLLNRAPGGRQLVFVGVEDRGDDPVLYSVEVREGATPVVLDDDADGFSNAVFRGSNVVYTAITGTDRRDVEIRQVRADGRGRFETLYEEAVLLSVRWDTLYQFSR